MITYSRVKTAEQYDDVFAYCLAKNIQVPDRNSVVFGAYDEDGNLVGLSAVVATIQIEPIISESAFITKSLYMMALASASNITNEVEVVIKGDNKELIKCAEGFGFKKQDENMTILTRKT